MGIETREPRLTTHLRPPQYVPPYQPWHSAVLSSVSARLACVSSSSPALLSSLVSTATSSLFWPTRTSTFQHGRRPLRACRAPPACTSSCVLLTLFLGGIRFFAFIAIVLDICFVGCFAAIAYYPRHGANACKGVVNTPLGTGLSGEAAPGAGDWGYVCSLNTACFAVSIVNIFLFLVTAAVQFLLARHHQKEKRYGPSPSNNYTSGTGRRPFWKRNRGAARGTRDAEMATTATAPGHHGTTVRPSHETGMTGSTMNNAGHAPYASEPKYGQPGYGHNNGIAPAHHNVTG